MFILFSFTLFWISSPYRSSQDSDYVVTGGIDDAVKVWAWRNDQLELRHRLEGHALGVVSVDTSSDGKCKYLILFYFSHYYYSYEEIN